MSEKKAILAVSFGTSHKETREKTIGAIEEDMRRRFPDYQVRRAFTSGMIMRILRERDGIQVDNVAEALKRLADEGFDQVVLQPTHIINGDEYDKLMRQARECQSLFHRLNTGKPLLTDSADYEAVCRAIMGEFSHLKKDEALVLMGHGTGHFADAAYAALDYRFKALGAENVFVGTVEGYPGIEEVRGQVRKYSPRRVILLPLMVVAGDHAVNDMAGDEEDSWRSVFEKDGYETRCVLKGLGEFPEIREIYMEHILKAAKQQG
ncbi:MAG TPA: sirohydrochlorin cobaltochelatase [Candidatus Copromorpha excrementigallinarum]|uniref:Sirohydrochlorin cobaltochelatase n=1 Tax=Candidatus Allocopromorpha excrementigallinarum TaxID=2840742 RepID=A0A9D1I2V6_9FIRM|nr:sirohydrochlorin cobaltochelatase [Candidatus Copromorpha excrementigallinarum]